MDSQSPAGADAPPGVSCAGAWREAVDAVLAERAGRFGTGTPAARAAWRAVPRASLGGASADQLIERGEGRYVLDLLESLAAIRPLPGEMSGA